MGLTYSTFRIKFYIYSIYLKSILVLGLGDRWDRSIEVSVLLATKTERKGHVAGGLLS